MQLCTDLRRLFVKFCEVLLDLLEAKHQKNNRASVALLQWCTEGLTKAEGVCNRKKDSKFPLLCGLDGTSTRVFRETFQGYETLKRRVSGNDQRKATVEFVDQPQLQQRSHRYLSLQPRRTIPAGWMVTMNGWVLEEMRS
ncbi:hypothetical protein Tco_0154294 [Tanacetum coccineum]